MEINVPYMAEIDGKAIPTQGITIKLDRDTMVTVTHDLKGSTTISINEDMRHTLDNPEPEEKPKCGYLSGVPLEVDIDTAFTDAPTMGSRVS